MRAILVTILLLVIAGAVLWFTNHLGHFGTPADPNDPRQAGLLTPDVLRHNLSGASDALLWRVQKGEITDEQFKDMMARAANSLLDQVDTSRIPSKSAWEYGEIYITARRWNDAKKALETAVKVAKGEDRRVNDNLHLARVMVELGDIPGAVKTARGVFDTPDEGAAPILPATLLEIVPAAEGKSHDAELAALLEDAIKCEMRTIVDQNSKPGQAFLAARPFHVRNAWAKVIDLYTAAGKNQEAQAAREKALAMRQQTART